MNLLRRLIMAIIVPLVLAIGVRIFIVEPVNIKGESMLPTFEDGDITFIFKRMKPEKGDVVFLSSANDMKVVKRLVAEEGDRVAIMDGTFYLNGLIDDRHENIRHTLVLERTLKDNEIYVLGDNVNHSSDSRDIDYTMEDYLGKALFFIRDYKIHKVAD